MQTEMGHIVENEVLVRALLDALSETRVEIRRGVTVKSLQADDEGVSLLLDDGKLRLKGMAVIPLEMYFDEHNRVKLCIGLARGKKLYDKRDDMARRDADREIRRALKDRSR